MADSPNKKTIDELKTIGEMITNTDKSALDSSKKIVQSTKKVFETKKEISKEELKQIKLAERKKKIEETTSSEFSSYAKQYRKLDPLVRQQLGGLKQQAGLYSDLTAEAARQKAIEQNNVGVIKNNAELRREGLESVISGLKEQASATATAEDDLRGLSDYQKAIRDIELNRAQLGNNISDRLLDAVNQTELLRLKEERLKQIKEEQQGMYEALPDSIKSAVSFAKKLGMALKNGALPLVIIAALVAATISAFTKLDEAAKEFRNTTGLTNSQMKDIRSDVNELTAELGFLGVEAKNVFDTIAALKGEFSDIDNFSKGVVGTLTVLNSNFGVSAETGAQVQGVFERMGNLSSETAANLQLQVANMANLAGVAPAKVMGDIADAAEESYKFFKGDVTQMAKTAVEARRLGTNLKDVLATTEKLLDFEGGIEAELEAAAFVGGQFNLSRARGLAYAGKELEAQQEILDQIQRSGDFRKQDYFTQKALAAAAGMEVGEVIKQLNQREKLASLSVDQKAIAEEAINAGLDITNLNQEQLEQELKKYKAQQEQQSQLEQLQNAFMGIAVTIGSVLTPLLEAIVPIMTLILTPFQWIAEAIQMIVGSAEQLAVFLTTAATLSAIIYRNKIKTFAVAKMAAIQEKIQAGWSLRGAIGSIFSGQGKLPVVGIAFAAALVAALFGAMAKAPSPTGDLISVADGKTQVSTKEGGLFELSPNDDLVAAPGAASALANQSGGGGGTDVSKLMDPLTKLYQEMSAMRNDLVSGKVRTYMDSDNVTAKVARTADKSTRNNFAFGKNIV